MNELGFLRSLRSVRAFSQEPVEAADVERIIETARWTGSARNRQPWRFIAVTDQALRERLSRLGPYAHHLAAAPLVLVALSEDNGYSDTEFDAGRVSQTICLAAHALGLGSCLATLHRAANIATAAQTLGVSGLRQPRHAISLGRPAPEPPVGRLAIPSGRLPVTALLSTGQQRVTRAPEAGVRLGQG